jgi:3-phenylpropionate/trans-cinnamate dioxygenase ferredoxin subunit
MAWIKLAEQRDITDGNVLGLDVAGKKVALFCQGSEYFATSNVCTHQYALLSEGYFEDGCIECPLHQARFDIRTGRAECAPASVDLAVFPVKVEDGQVYADIE